MSASNRKLSRLPLQIFEDLVTRPPIESRKDDPESLKSAICSRLKRFPIPSTKKNGIRTSTTCSVKTIGQLIRLPKSLLLGALDPILTYGKYYNFNNTIEFFVQRV
jgi:hypothetical protein